MFFTTTKVKAHDFRGGYLHSKIGKKVQQIRHLRSYQKKALYQALEEKGKQGSNLTRIETSAIIRQFVDNSKDLISATRAKKLAEDLKQVTGYDSLSWSDHLAIKYGRQKEQNQDKKEELERKTDKEEAMDKQRHTKNHSFWSIFLGMEKSKNDLIQENSIQAKLNLINPISEKKQNEERILQKENPSLLGRENKLGFLDKLFDFLKNK